MDDDALQKALHLFGLTPRLTHAQLDQKYKELLAVWHPHRYANLTNNPRKYMQMYTKAEAMTKELQAAYELLASWIASQESHPS